MIGISKKGLWVLLMLSPLAVSCRDNGGEPLASNGVLAGIEDPVCGNVVTKALDVDFGFFFQDEDHISVFPSGGDEYMTYRLAPSKGVSNRASFIVENFRLKDGTYYAFYPAVKGVCNPEAIELDFTGQKQSGNGSSDHLAEFDFCRSAADIRENSGYFGFSHLVSWLKIRIPCGRNNSCFAKLYVAADEGIPTSASFNVIDGKLTYPDRLPQDVLELKIGGEDGVKLTPEDTLTAYLALPSNVYNNLILRTESPDGKDIYEYTFKGEYNLAPGHYYVMTVGESNVVTLDELDSFGLYKCYENAEVHMWETCILKPREEVEQISWYKGKDRSVFQFFELGTGTYASFVLSTPDPEVGQHYEMDIESNAGNICKQADFVVIKRNETTAWLYDGQDGLGCIIKLDD